MRQATARAIRRAASQPSPREMDPADRWGYRARKRVHSRTPHHLRAAHIASIRGADKVVTDLAAAEPAPETAVAVSPSTTT